MKNVKILITYHSDTGNTEKVGKAMKEALDEEGQDVTAIHAKEVDSSSLKSYDLVVIGSSILGSQLGKHAKALLSKVELPPKIAFFYTFNKDLSNTYRIKTIMFALNYSIVNILYNKPS